jgi:hypothetical protein
MDDPREVAFMRRVPNPGERPGLRNVWALTFQLTILY